MTLILSACVTLFRRTAVHNHHRSSFEVLLVKRGLPPKAGYWAVPGGKHDPHLDSTLVDTAIREMFEETGLRVVVNPNCFFKHVAAGGKYELHHFWAERLEHDSNNKQPLASTDASDIAWMNVDDILNGSFANSASTGGSNEILFVEDLGEVLQRAKNMLDASHLRFV